MRDITSMDGFLMEAGDQKVYVGDAVYAVFSTVGSHKYITLTCEDGVSVYAGPIHLDEQVMSALLSFAKTPKTPKDKSYLGDGVYASVANGMIQLSVDTQTRPIYLEPEVMDQLVVAAKRMKFA